MQRKIILNDELIPYTIRYSNRARYINLVISACGEFIVSLPNNKTFIDAEKFIKNKKAWVLKNIKGFKSKPLISVPSYHGRKQELLKKYASVFVAEKINSFNEHYKFKFKKVYIKAHKAQWGSCSVKKNLNFNYKIIFLPEDVSEYIIVHELCHLKEMNHSKAFWSLVSKTLPNYHETNKKLSKYNIA